MQQDKAATYLKEHGFTVELDSYSPCGDGDCGHKVRYRIDNVPLCYKHLLQTVEIVKGWATEGRTLLEEVLEETATTTH